MPHCCLPRPIWPIWALAGVVAYVLDRPHGSLAAGAVVIAAGAYELTPVKRDFLAALP